MIEASLINENASYSPTHRSLCSIRGRAPGYTANMSLRDRHFRDYKLGRRKQRGTKKTLGFLVQEIPQDFLV